MIDYNLLNNETAPLRKIRKPHSDITKRQISESQKLRFKRLKMAENLFNDQIDGVCLYFEDLKNQILHDLKRISSNLKQINNLCQYSILKIEAPANQDIIETITNQAISIVKNELNKLNEDEKR